MARSGDAAVVDDDDAAIEGGADGVGGTYECGHVLVFVAGERAGEGIDDDQRRRVGELRFDVGDQGGAILDQVDAASEKLERHRADMVLEEFAAPKIGAAVEAGAAFQRDIEDKSLIDAAAAIFAAQGDVH